MREVFRDDTEGEEELEEDIISKKNKSVKMFVDIDTSSEDEVAIYGLFSAFKSRYTVENRGTSHRIDYAEKVLPELSIDVDEQPLAS